MSKLKYHWFFIFCAMFAFIYSWLQPSYLSIGICILIFIRLITLKNKLLLVMSLVISLLIVGRVRIMDYEMKEHLQINYQSVEQTQVKVDPYQLEFRDGYARGYGYLFDPQQERWFKVYLTFKNPEGTLYQQFEGTPSIVQVKGVLKRPASNRNFYLFNFQKYLKIKQIIWHYDVLHVEAIRSNPSIASRFYKLRNQIVGQYNRYQTHPWFALFHKLLLNKSTEFYRDQRDTFQIMGVMHLFAISGFHIVMLHSYFSYFLKRMSILNDYAYYIVFAILICYASLIDWPIGVTRSMFMLYVTPHIMRRTQCVSRVDLLSILSITLLIINPYEVWSIGYILSFLISYVLIFSPNSSVMLSIRDTFKVSMTIILFTWPIMLQSQYTLHLAQIITMTLIGILFEKIILPFMLLSGLIIFLPESVQHIFVLGFDAIAEIMINFFEILSSISPSIILGYLPHGLFIGLMIVALYQLYSKEKKRRLLVVTITYLLLICVYPYCNFTTKITIIDVGQGMAVLYQLPFNQGTWLIDTGGKYAYDTKQIDRRYAHYNIIPAMKALGVQSLSGIILTHLDLDHVGNLPAILETFPVESVLLLDNLMADDFIVEQKNTFQNVSFQGIPEGRLYKVWNESIQLASLTSDELTTSTSLSNDHSIGVRLKIGNLSFLTLGDMSTPFEERFIQQFPSFSPDILLLSHHGSRHSSSETFLSIIEAKLLLNSAGENNHYHHPHSEVIERVEALSKPYFSTHSGGAIQLIYFPYIGLQVRQVFSEKPSFTSKDY